MATLVDAFSRKWWSESIKSDSILRSTPAKERVEIIKQATGLEHLIAAEK